MRSKRSRPRVSGGRVKAWKVLHRPGYGSITVAIYSTAVYKSPVREKGWDLSKEGKVFYAERNKMYEPGPVPQKITKLKPWGGIYIDEGLHFYLTESDARENIRSRSAQAIVQFTIPKGVEFYTNTFDGEGVTTKLKFVKILE